MTNVVLAIDTATPAVTAGIVRRDGDRIDVLAERVTVDARAHAEQLTPNVLAALADAGITVNDVNTVVVGCGPGPFTGLRVGMATAAAYGQALGIAVHGVCSLDAIGIDTAGEVLVVTDARRREVYWARYRDGRARRRAGGQRGRRCADRRWRGCRFARARRALQPAPAARGLPDGVGPGAGRRLDGTAAAAGPAVSPPSRCQAAGNRRCGAVTVTYDGVGAGRRRALRGAGGATVRRRRPLARGGIPAGTRRHAHPLRRCARGRQARRVRRHLATRAKAALRVRDPHHRSRSRLPGPRHRSRTAHAAAGVTPTAALSSWRCGRTTRPRSGCMRAPVSSTSVCASATTGSAAPTPTR